MIEEITPETVKEWSVEELQENYVDLWEMVERIECYGINDLMLKEMIAQELERRGYQIYEEASVAFIKDEEGE